MRREQRSFGKYRRIKETAYFCSGEQYDIAAAWRSFAPSASPGCLLLYVGMCTLALQQPSSAVWLFLPRVRLCFFLKPAPLGVWGPKRREAECTTRVMEQHEARWCSVSFMTGKDETSCATLGRTISHLADYGRSAVVMVLFSSGFCRRSVLFSAA
jgi:hypothetical protein